jgi:hypothetical protein
MRIDNIIRKLYKEREHLDRLIATMRQIQSSAALRTETIKVSKRRGRKSMDIAERRQVAERMRNYWAARRATVRPQAVAQSMHV